MEKRSIIQIIKFTLFSISAGIIETVLFTLLNEVFLLDYWLAYLPSLIASVLWNFTFNRRYTFQSAANVPVAMVKVFLFYLVFTPLSTYLGHLAESANVNEYIIYGVTLLCNFVLEFLYCKFIVYKNQEYTKNKI